MSKLLIFFTLSFVVILTVMTIILGSMQPAAPETTATGADSVGVKSAAVTQNATADTSGAEKSPAADSTAVVATPGQNQTDVRAKLDSLQTLLAQYQEKNRELQQEARSADNRDALTGENNARKIAKIYENMSAAEAAKILAGLGVDEAASIIAAMKKRQAARVLAAMDANLAIKVSKKIASLN